MSFIVIVGHRGTGKSSFLKRYAKYFPEQAPFYDLDAEIERAIGHSVSDIFESHGETTFREIELQIFEALATVSAVIAVGAGFPVQKIPTGATVIWVRRDSDLIGRVFIDRPRLLKDRSALEEFEIKRAEREKHFQTRANVIHTLPEGLELSQYAQTIEKELFQGLVTHVGGIKTLYPEDLHHQSLAQPELFEIRDDLLDPSSVEAVFKDVTASVFLYSVRENKNLPKNVLEAGGLIDFPVESLDRWLSVPASRLIVSSHLDRVEEACESLKKAPAGVFNLKLSPLIETWKDLSVGHAWQQQDPEHRSFLPRSKNGRWKWYRLYQKGRQKINFWYDGQSSAPDQPRLLDWLLQPSVTHRFAAVLGSPVKHSFSPMMHLDFFKEKKMPFFAVDIKESEWDEALDFLKTLGLMSAAVTSPLKMSAFTSCWPMSELAKELQSVNTLAWDSEASRWLGDNTDFAGFKNSLNGIEIIEPVAIWGGQGTLPMVKKILPGAAAYSARTGHPKGNESVLPRPGTLVWAAPARSDLSSPPVDWKPRAIVDLNYSENSSGRDYAVQTGAKYHSGLDFFHGQGVEQQKFWSRNL
jgi:shikimate kinase